MWYIYINDLNEGVVGTIIRSADDTKLGMHITLEQEFREMDIILKEKGKIQKVLDRPKQWA